MKRLGFWIISALVSGLAYFQLAFFQSQFFGWTLLLLSLFFLSKVWKKIYADWLGEKELLAVGTLSVLTPFVLLGFFVGICLTWYKANSVLISSSFFLTWILSFELFLKIKKSQTETLFDIGALSFPSLSPPGFLPAVYIFLWVLAIVGLQHPSTAILFSPWQTLPTFLLVLFFILSFLLVYLLCVSNRNGLLIFLIILHSFLLHSALPLSHELPWGGDVWRMIAIEEKFIQEKPLLPVLFGKEALWRDIGPVSLPEALVIPNKYIYGHLWGQTVLLARFTFVDLITLNRFLVPFVWSIFVPLLAYVFARRFALSEKKSIIVAFLTLMPFSLQAMGSFTLAVSWGFIIFLLLLCLWFGFLQTKNVHMRNFALLMGVFSLFGYTLFSLMFWFIVLMTFCFQMIQSKKIQNMTLILFGIISVLFFPLIELVLKISAVPEKIIWFTRVKQFVGEWSGWFFAHRISVSDMPSANVIVNHVPANAFVQNMFTIQRWHVFVFMVLLIFCVCLGLVWIARKKEVSFKILFLLVCIVAGGYGIGWYILEGERFFVRRLDPIFAFLLMFVGLLGLFSLERIWKSLKNKTVIFVVLAIFFSATMTTVFASGPDSRVVSRDEYNVAQFISGVSMKPACILADTWVLLALEGVSKTNIIGGGFPIDEKFGQKERVEIYTNFLQSPDKSVKAKIAQYVPASECLVVVPKNSKNLSKIRENLNILLYQNKTLEVWRIQLKNS